MQRDKQLEFVNKVFELVGDSYAVLGKYKNSKTKILMRHNEGCGHEWEVQPYHFLKSSTRCIKCSGKMKRTTESFKEEVLELVGDEYEVMGEYTNSHTQIPMLHKICGNIWGSLPKTFLHRGARCTFCSGNTKKDTDQFKKEVYELVGDEYTVLTEYETAYKQIIIRHNVCGFEYPIRPNSFLNGNRCTKCMRKRMSELYCKTTDQFKKEVYEAVGDEYIVLGEYTGTNDHILMKHDIESCGYEWNAIPHAFFKRRHRCLNATVT